MNLLQNLRSNRDLFANLTLRELRGKYKRSVLGWAWSLVNPLATMAVFSVVFRFFLKVEVAPGDPSGLHIFALWLLCGLLPWNFLSNGMTGGMAALLGNANLIKKVFFPRSLLVAASVSALGVSLLIELGVLSVALLVVGNMVILWIPAVLLTVAVLALFVYGVALIVSVAAVYFRDLEHLLGILLQLWFYATPVIYPERLALDALEGHTWARVIYEANPMLHFVAIFRNLLYDLRFPTLEDCLIAGGATVLMLSVGLLAFRRLEPRLAEEL